MIFGICMYILIGLLVSAIRSEHMQSHIQGDDYYKCLCPICGNKYRTSTKLKDHMRCHSEEKPFKCDNCNKGRVWFGDGHAFIFPEIMLLHLLTAFYSKAKLRSHSLSHLTIKPHNCSICGKGFSMRHNWKYHMMYVVLKSITKYHFSR